MFNPFDSSNKANPFKPQLDYHAPVEAPKAPVAPEPVVIEEPIENDPRDEE